MHLFLLVIDIDGEIKGKDQGGDSDMSRYSHSTVSNEGNNHHRPHSFVKETLDNQGYYISHWKTERSEVDADVVHTFRHYTDQDFLFFLDENIEDNSIVLETVEEQTITKGVITKITAEARVFLSGKEYVEARSGNSIGRQDNSDSDSGGQGDITVISTVLANVEHISTTPNRNIAEKGKTLGEMRKREEVNGEMGVKKNEIDSESASTSESRSRLDMVSVLHFDRDYYLHRELSHTVNAQMRRPSNADTTDEDKKCPDDILPKTCKSFPVNPNLFNFGLSNKRNFNIKVNGQATIGYNKCKSDIRNFLGRLKADVTLTVLNRDYDIFNLFGEYGFINGQPLQNKVTASLYKMPESALNSILTPVNNYLGRDLCKIGVIPTVNKKLTSKTNSFTYSVFNIIDLTLSLTLDLEFQMNTEYQYCVRNLSAFLEIVPELQIKGTVEVGASIGFAKGGVGLNVQAALSLNPHVEIDGSECSFTASAYAKSKAVKARLYGWYSFCLILCTDKKEGNIWTPEIIKPKSFRLFSKKAGIVQQDNL